MVAISIAAAMQLKEPSGSVEFFLTERWPGPQSSPDLCEPPVSLRGLCGNNTICCRMRFASHNRRKSRSHTNLMFQCESSNVRGEITEAVDIISSFSSPTSSMHHSVNQSLADDKSSSTPSPCNVNNDCAGRNPQKSLSSLFPTK